jgi:AcrR family transcriptional regulator
MGKGEQTRERIVDQALRLASRDGLEGLTLGSLAAELELSKSGLFAHFGSKEELQLQVLQEIVTRFKETVVLPAFKAPRGEPRIRAMFENWLKWGKDPSLPGGCPMVAAAVELDDRPGAARDFLVAAKKDLVATLVKSARIAVEAGHFRPDLDCEQFAFELDSLYLGFHHARRLLQDEKAEAKLRAAFEQLLKRAAKSEAVAQERGEGGDING